MPILEIKKLSKYFGGVAAVDNLDVNFHEAKITGIIGPNGAGKTTLFNLITGFYQPNSGKVIFKGEDITGLKPHEITQKGIVRTFQTTTLLMRSTVLENVLTAFHLHYKTAIWKAFLHTRSSRNEERATRQRALEVVEFLGLASHKDKLAQNLSSGLQKLLAIAIGYATSPKLLLLDEPVTTLSPDKVEMVMKVISNVRNAGTTILIIEHNMKAIMDYCDTITVLAYGKKLVEGSAKEVAENNEVIESYLGAKY